MEPGFLVMDVRLVHARNAAPHAPTRRVDNSETRYTPFETILRRAHRRFETIL